MPGCMVFVNCDQHQERVYNMGFDRWGDSTHKMTAFRHFSESTELDLSFNHLTEVRAGIWEVSDGSLPALLWIYRAWFISQRPDRGEDVGGKSLEQLYLRNNKIKVIQPGAFPLHLGDQSEHTYAERRMLMDLSPLVKLGIVMDILMIDTRIFERQSLSTIRTDILRIGR